ncbi:MAG TPA: ATP-binding protein [Longimicrobiales bacterium]|nr:ATP-binding protein [Longimicrobiales bacterium]
MAPWLALLSVGVWAAWPGPASLFVASALVVLALLSGRPKRSLRSLALVLLLATTAIGFLQLDARRRVRTDWPGEWAREEERILEELQEALAPFLDGGPEAANTLAGLVADGNPPTHREVSRLRRGRGFHAAAIFDATGRLVVWDGEHRGRVPEAVAMGNMAFFYQDLPLAGYLYATAPAGAGTAMVAALLRSDLPEGVRRAAGDFESRFEEETGARIRIQRPDRVGEGAGVYDLNWEDQPLLSVSVERPTEAARLRALDRWSSVWGTVGVVLAWIILALVPGPARIPWAVGTGLALALLLPAEALVPNSDLASPAAFLLRDLPLIRWLVLLAAVGVALGLTRPPRVLPAWAVAACVAVLFPVLGAAWRGSVSADVLAGPDDAWLPVVLSLGVAMTLVSWLLQRLLVADLHEASDLRAAAGWAVLVLLPLLAAVAAGLGPGLPAAALAVWGVPLLLWGGPGLARLRRSTGLVWLAAGLLGGGAAVPYLWGGRIEARMTLAEAQVERLGVQEDPYLEFLLTRLARSLDSLSAEGVRPVEMLYGAWRGSGLAEASYPIWLTLWTEGGLPREDLRIGMSTSVRPGVANALSVSPVADTFQVLRYERADAHYAVQVPLLDEGWVATGVVPPVRDGGSELLLGPLFGSLEEERGPPLTLVPLLPGEPSGRDTLEWIRTASGWRGELALAYPDALYHAHYEVELPGGLVAVARATLMMLLVLLLSGLPWAAGRALRGLSGPVLRESLGVFRSFRARVTVALFAFFALSNLIFGTLAYRTIVGASQRAAQVLSERLVNEAAMSYEEVSGVIELLAQRVDADLLEYRDGALWEGSLEPLVELGLYEGWVPYPLYSALSEREVLMEAVPTRVGDWAYVTAYRRLVDGDILGAPVPLETGATAFQSREVAHLLGFALVAGLGLSLVLALLVGQALARPIQALRIASERVGSGNLGMRLPTDRSDEFGTVFHAFNRMVRRLRRARRSLVRNTRRTRAIVEDVATGVVALDPEGEVVLANARARALLQLEIREGEPLEAGDAASGEVVEWLHRIMRDGLLEGGTEAQVGERRLRIQARRITREGPQDSGVVMSVEDVTDELRSERILAWGEMARQVAHEVKNPLTPIKLSVQHLRRAWDDQRMDFGEILDRNAEAMLGEIDRLAAIASGFSRFGAPEAAEGPLEAVDLVRVTRDTMTLYGSGEGPVRFELLVDEHTPLVQARETEVKEVLVNLLENSRAAMPGEGRVAVEVDRDGDDAVVMRVKDEGTGIPAELLGRIFEPHFSTRSAGTGLGLAIVRRIVESWEGSVSVTSREGEGTLAEVRFQPWRA